MSTRSVTIVRSKWDHQAEYETHTRIYRHFDGYPEGHGQWLYEYLNDMVVVNGLRVNMPSKYVNGPGRLAAGITGALIDCGHDPDLLASGDDRRQDYTYRISVDYGEEGGKIFVEVFTAAICNDADKIFEGTVAEFGSWLKTVSD